MTTQELDLTLDFSNLDYITSAGLRTLLVARKKLPSERMRIVHANASVYDVFEITGFNSFISIEADQAQEKLCDDPSFKQVLSYRVKTTPDRQIFFLDDRAYTWQDVDDCSQIIADDLSRLGVRKGSHVGIMGRNSINWIFTFFAVQKLGGIVVLLNFSQKAGEIVLSSQIGDITHR